MATIHSKVWSIQRNWSFIQSVRIKTLIEVSLGMDTNASYKFHVTHNETGNYIPLLIFTLYSSSMKNTWVTGSLFFDKTFCRWWIYINRKIWICIICIIHIFTQAVTMLLHAICISHCKVLLLFLIREGFGTGHAVRTSALVHTCDNSIECPMLW